LGLAPTGRSAKSTISLVAKLRRECIRLSQVQDMAGCRVVTPDLAEQDRVIDSLRAHFPEATVVDRRVRPSHGYRAVHVIVRHAGKPIEIQVRSALQHLWAELSERISDVVGLDVKYGGATGLDRAFLEQSAELIQSI
jgi:ppGpp synthetase/RelA/SpoT-type nucleotidyltranferase